MENVGCISGKKPYATSQAAVAAFHYGQKAFGWKGIQTPYTCSDCHMWHLTSQPERLPVPVAPSSSAKISEKMRETVNLPERTRLRGLDKDSRNDQIRTLRAEGWTFKKLAEEFDLSEGTIEQIVHKKGGYSDSCPKPKKQSLRSRWKRLGCWNNSRLLRPRSKGYETHKLSSFLSVQIVGS
jgi:hypothetical protein